VPGTTVDISHDAARSRVISGRVSCAVPGTTVDISHEGARSRKIAAAVVSKQGANLLARGDRKPARWNKDRQRKKKARDARQIVEKKAAAAAKR
jgi:hypothetical protein